jgi:hypothetical protein
MKITKKHPLPWGVWTEQQPPKLHDVRRREIRVTAELLEILAEAMNDTICEKCGGDGTVMCGWCNGSGQGGIDGTRCPVCKGKSVVPCVCQEEERGG